MNVFAEQILLHGVLCKFEEAFAIISYLWYAVCIIVDNNKFKVY